MARITQLLLLTAGSGVGADFLGAPLSGSTNLGLIGMGSKQAASLGPLASAAALEPSLVSASQHVAGLIAHAKVADQAPKDPHPSAPHSGRSHLGLIGTESKQANSLGPRVFTDAREHALASASQHIAGLIAHASVAKQAPKNPNPSDPHSGSSHLGLIATEGKQAVSLGPLSSGAFEPPSASQHFVGLVAHASVAEQAPKKPHPSAPHSGSSHLGLIRTESRQEAFLGSLASAAALELSLDSSSQHVAGLIAHASVAEQATKEPHPSAPHFESSHLGLLSAGSKQEVSLGPRAFTVAREHALASASQHVAGPIAHASVAEQAPEVHPSDPHSGSSHLGLVPTGSKQADSLGSLASAVALEPSLVSASQHVAGLIAHASIAEQAPKDHPSDPHSGSSHLGLVATGSKQAVSLGPLASAVAMEPSLVSAFQHVAGLIAHASVAEQAPKDHLSAPQSGSSHLGLVTTGRKQAVSLGPLAVTVALEPSLVSASQHVAGLIAHASVAEIVPDDPHPNWKGAPVDKKATIKVGANGAGFVGSGRAPKLERASVGVSVSIPPPPTYEEVTHDLPPAPTIEELTPEVPELPEVPSIREYSPDLPDPPKHVVPQEWGQRKCFYLMILLLSFCGCFGVVAQQEHGLHIGSAVAVTPAFLLLGYMFTQTDVMFRFWHGEQVGWWCAVLCFWATLQLLFGLAVLATVGVSAAIARKQQAAEAQGASQV